MPLEMGGGGGTLALWDMKFGTGILFYKRMVEKKFKIAAIGMMTSLIMSISLENLGEKWLKYVFFLKITL